MPRSIEQFKKMQDDRKEKILAAARYCFAFNGIKSTSIDDIMSKAKSAHGLFYHYYSSKEDVLMELIDIASNIPNAIPPLQQAKYEKGMVGLERLIRHYEGVQINKDESIVLFNLLLLNLQYEESVPLPKLKQLNPLPSFEILIKQGQEEGRLINGNNKEIAKGFVSLLIGSLESRVKLGLKENRPISGDVLLEYLNKFAI